MQHVSYTLIQNQCIFLKPFLALRLGNKLLQKLNLSCEKYRKLIRLINNYSEFSLGNVTYIQYLCDYEQDLENEKNYDVVSEFDVPRDISIEIGFLG
jgi:hypothetical protein